MVGVFCRIQSLLQGCFAKETCNFKGPTNRSHPIHIFQRCAILTGVGRITLFHAFITQHVAGSRQFCMWTQPYSPRLQTCEHKHTVSLFLHVGYSPFPRRGELKRLYEWIPESNREKSKLLFKQIVRPRTIHSGFRCSLREVEIGMRNQQFTQKYSLLHLECHVISMSISLVVCQQNVVKETWKTRSSIEI